MPGLNDLAATDLARGIAEGAYSAEEVTEACLARIAEVDPKIEAWAFIDPEAAKREARLADLHRRSGRTIGPLHGLPVGVKDIIDVKGMPTENGTVLDAGRRPSKDAVLVSFLRAAGAVILGKTVTTELAYFAPSKTRNPHDPDRTPGGSSSGSAAAVASAMAPLAIGTQTNGSMIRPAAFCGVVGFKPTRGLIPRTGVLTHAQHLDTVGVFARSVADAALLADSLIGHDPFDPATFPAGTFQLTRAAAAAPPLPPQLAFARSPVWEKAEPETQEAFTELAGVLGDQCEPVELPPAFAESHDLLTKLMIAGFAHRLGSYYDRGKDQLSWQMQSAIEAGRQVPAHEFLSAVDRIDLMNVALEQIFSRYDAILTPAAAGVAPSGLESTGDPAFCTIWQLAGTPAISLPLLHGKSGLPIGVQLVGRRGDDHRLIRTAAWLSSFVAEAAAEP